MIFLEIDYITNDFKIIDIRDSVSYNIKHLPNSVNIDFYKLIIEPSKYLSKNKKYLLVCLYGIKSKNTSVILNKMGYHTYSLKDGIKRLLKK